MSAPTPGSTLTALHVAWLDARAAAQDARTFANLFSTAADALWALFAAVTSDVDANHISTMLDQLSEPAARALAAQEAAERTEREAYRAWYQAKIRGGAR